MRRWLHRFNWYRRYKGGLWYHRTDSGRWTQPVYRSCLDYDEYDLYEEYEHPTE